MLNTRYRNSPIVSGRGRLLGARAPDPELVCAGVATLVLYDMPAEAAAGAAALHVDTHVLSHDAADRWRMHGPFAALVRPDGHIGWIAPNPTPSEIDTKVRSALGRVRA
jgi:hypothetical protein